MKKVFSLAAILILSVLLVSGCGKKANSKEVVSNEHTGNGGTSTPVSVSTFSPYYYRSDASGMSIVLTNSNYASWIQLSPTESTRVYVELYLEESGKFTLSYFEMQAGISDSTVLNEQTVKGEWKVTGDKLTLSDVATLSRKVNNKTVQLTIGFLRDIQTAGLKGKQTNLVSESRVYTALE